MFDKICSIIGKFVCNKNIDAIADQATPAHPNVKGTSGKIETDAVILKQGENLVMVLDYDLGDMPSSIQWNKNNKSMSITQNGGEIANIDAVIPPEESTLLDIFKRLILVTRVGEDRVSHMVPFSIKA